MNSLRLVLAWVRWVYAFLRRILDPLVRDRRYSGSAFLTVGMAYDVRMAGGSPMEGPMPHAAQETLRRVAWELWDSHSRINRLLGKELPYDLRIPFQCCLGGWQFEGVWKANPVMGSRGWTLEGLLELPQHEPQRLCIRSGPRGGPGERGEGPGRGPSGLEGLEGQGG